ncbi:ATP-binding cassette domain-containing protein [Pelosinus sp. sgz500959]|uniref:ABC transporter ATP-binding protein n=1 Tax=Pelosinus sp. sgz500959 TaxID=3242472 RepID=UPI00366A6D27
MYQSVSVKLVNVSKKIGSRVLFEGLTVTVNSGQCLAITGPNGSGKSTLLKMIAGLSRATTGTIQVLGDGKMLDTEARLACLGLVSPEIVFYADMTGSENLLFFVRVRGGYCSAEQVADYCQIVGLTAAKDQLVQTYSTGMRQRLKFALILALKPLLWLLDEPSSNLDADGKRLVSKMIGDGLVEQTTVIIATNEPWEAQNASYKIELV